MIFCKATETLCILENSVQINLNLDNGGLLCLFQVSTLSKLCQIIKIDKIEMIVDIYR